MTSPTVAEAQPSFQPIEYCSTLPYGWIPENGTDFFALFMKFLKEKWLETCKQAEEHLENRRRQQLHKKGDDPRFIFHLAEDAKTRAKLRNILRNQIRGIKKLVTEYHDSYSESPIPQLSHKQIESFDVEINDEFGQLEQSIKDLLHFEFSWASINEAHRSTSIATSIKRLSWITFIFLPAMFASVIRSCLLVDVT
ncbi:hypothetical protein DM02DRAFT_544386 [Periconia macrospinosa]|uniref:SPX domain-containing protein n=1 Tax=Periconia macrospinosa TaxID=97972 RepID=A0A2V1D4F0_9PLEO|nr:hypothetical protein DM02DRAFT_544386 [Periconia macrospinosa]